MSKHATIIGAGIVGISAASFLQREGYQVTVIDRVPPGEGASFGNAGGVAFGEIMPTIHPKVFLKIPGWLIDPLGPLTVRWRHLPKALPWFIAAARNTTPKKLDAITKARASLGLRVVSDFETLLKAAGTDDLLVKRETLRVFDTEAQFEAEAEERHIKAELGFPCEVFSGDAAREMEPALSKNIKRASFHGGWYFVKNPERVVKSLAAEVVRNGGKIIQDDVQRIEVQGGVAKALQLKNAGLLPLDRLVICGGAYSHLLAGQLGDHVLLEAERGYHIVLPNAGVSISRSITSARTPAVATPMEMGLRLAGTAEFGGLDAPENWARANVLPKIFKQIFPDLKEPDEAATRWMGRRPSTPDSMPVIGPSQHVSNVWYGFGHGHMGLTWGPSTGRMISEMIVGKPSNLDLTAFRVNRF